MVACAQCGSGNDSDAAFCQACGHFLAWSDLSPAERARQSIDAGRTVAAELGRPDLDEQLQAADDRLLTTAAPVVICGEQNHGKSSLINALVKCEVCPVDADVATSATRSVRYADEPRLTAYPISADGTRIEERALAFEDLLAAETSSEGAQLQTEVGLPNPLLRTGLVLIDTPGIGGLESAHGLLTLGALRQAAGVCVVTAAAQELTGPELDFLRTAYDRCRTLTLVVTKVDIYPHWRTIVGLNRGHLDRHGLADVSIIPVSSLLARLPGLDDESGFRTLLEFLLGRVVHGARDAAAQSTAAAVDLVARQLNQQTVAEQVALRSPAEAGRVLGELQSAQDRARRLAAENASWQQVLGDGIQDLVADVRHDLQRRVDEVERQAEELIDGGDPAHTWDDTEIWLRREVAAAAVANRDLMHDRARELVTSVANRFELLGGADFALDLGGVGDADLSSVALASAESLAMPGGRLAPLMLAGRSSYALPMMAGSMMATAFGLIGTVTYLAIAGGVLLIGTGIGQKVFRDERTRQLTYRQQQAKLNVRRFLAKVVAMLNKQTEDQLRQTQRQLRDEFQGRAMLLAQSAEASAAAVGRAVALGPSERQQRRAELARSRSGLDRLRAATTGDATQ